MLRPLLLTLFVSAFAAGSIAQERCTAHTITERWLAAHGQDPVLGHAAAHAPRSAARGGLLTIPVVVHVVWNTAAENVPDGVILDMLDQMNADYQALNSDFNNIRATFAADRANVQFAFCLANTDPNGNATTGITRTQTTETWFDPDTETDDMKAAPLGHAPWDPSSYLNIWICDISSGATGGLVTAGYAYLPYGGMVGSAIDGLVVDYSYGTDPSNRTATHEVGHYLGLLHPWGDGDCANNDFLADTPPTDEPTFSCSNTSLMRCPGSLTMYENFMDYSDCTMMFTHDQADLMTGTLTGDRADLLNSNGCSGGGPVEGCIPTSAAGTADGDFIDGVVLGDIANTGSGGVGAPTYTDHSAQFSTSLTRGAQYTMEVTSGNYAPDNYAVWIDYDHDNVYTPAEKLGEFTTETAAETWAITFDVPMTATLGTTRMRVRGVFFNDGEPTPVDPCFDYAYGETEDYGIVIVGDGGTGPCIPSSVNGTADGDFVDGVVLEDINNTGSGSTGGPTYQDYTAQEAILTRGGSYSLSVTSGEYDNDMVAAWIDFNADAVFSVDELVGDAVTTTAFETVPFSFTVPDDAELGPVRMRVRCMYPDVDAGEPEASDPCVDFSWGETEDYGVMIQASTGIAAVDAGGFTLLRNGEQLIASWTRTGTQQDLLMLDAAGRVVRSERPIGTTATLGLHGLAAGTYHVVVVVDGIRSAGRVFVDPLP